jgi:hypothetical protein
LNTEDPSAFVVARIKFEPTNVIAQKLGFILNKEYFTGTENGKANVLGAIKRNDAKTVDLQLVTYRDQQQVWQSGILHYSEQLGTATSDDQDMLPFAFLDISVDKEKDSFAIKDATTNQILFGPMTFLTLGDVGKSSDKFIDEGTAFNPYEEWWYYERPDTMPKEYFPTEITCKHSADTLFPGASLMCKSTLLKSVQVRLDIVHSKFKTADRKLVFIADTRGMELTLAMDISASAASPVASTVVAIPNPVKSNAGEFKKVAVSLSSASETTPYYIKVYDQATKQQFFAGMINPSRSELTKIFSNNSILTKTGAEILGLANIPDELDNPGPTPDVPDITVIDSNLLQNPLAGSKVSNIVEYVQLLFRKLPYMVRPALLISIALFGLNLIIRAPKTTGEEVKSRLQYILLGAGILLGTYALGTILTAVVSCFTGTSC